MQGGDKSTTVSSTEYSETSAELVEMHDANNNKIYSTAKSKMHAWIPKFSWGYTPRPLRKLVLYLHFAECAKAHCVVPPRYRDATIVVTLDVPLAYVTGSWNKL